MADISGTSHYTIRGTNSGLDGRVFERPGPGQINQHASANFEELPLVPTNEILDTPEGQAAVYEPHRGVARFFGSAGG